VRRAAELLGGFAALIWGVAVIGVLLDTSMGVVHEHCLDTNASKSVGAVRVDSQWTYIVWPPLFFDAVDPPGRCVRNTPLREGLDAVGVWKLPAPEEQVRRHIVSQLPGH
jgi:hypothetical protein